MRPASSGDDRLTDAVGVVHAPAGTDARIVCLVPSITELVCELGLSERLVGRTGFCIHPWETVRTIPKVGGTKDVLLDRVKALAPTHVIVNIDENRVETVRELAGFVPHIVVTHPQGPLDNLPLYRLLGGIFGARRKAERLCVRLERALESISGRAPAPQDVLYLIWREPWMTISRDTYISRTLELINWNTQPVETADRYPEINLASFAGRVDRVLLSSEPFHFHKRDIAEVRALVDGAQVSLIDGEMTSWYGSRAIQGIRYLAGYDAAKGRR